MLIIHNYIVDIAILENLKQYLEEYVYFYSWQHEVRSNIYLNVKS